MEVLNYQGLNRKTPCDFEYSFSKEPGVTIRKISIHLSNVISLEKIEDWPQMIEFFLDRSNNEISFRIWKYAPFKQAHVVGIEFY